MLDREKVIRGLECCVRYYDDENRRACVKCPYREPYPFTCMTLYPMLKDALEALKETEDGEPHPAADAATFPNRGRLTESSLKVE